LQYNRHVFCILLHEFTGIFRQVLRIGFCQVAGTLDRIDSLEFKILKQRTKVRRFMVIRGLVLHKTGIVIE
jgi:hypothetical protein